MNARGVPAAVASGKIQATFVAPLGTTANLAAVPGTFADLAAVQTYLVTLRAAVETRLDAIEAKIDEVTTNMKASGLMKTA